MPGDIGFDPLNICRGLPDEERVEFMEKELLNGRLAMIAITCYVGAETVFDVPVVRFTPDLFEPLIFAPDVRARGIPTHATHAPLARCGTVCAFVP